MVSRSPSGAAGRPGPAQHDPVGRRLGHPAQVRTGKKPPGRVAEADRRGLRPIGLVETLLASGDFLSDGALLADPATTALRGGNALPTGGQ